MRKQLEGLAEFIGTDRIIRVNRKPVDQHWLDGVVVGFSARLLLLQLVDGSTLQLNGYSAVRLADVRGYKEDDTFVQRALRLLKRAPAIPEFVDLTDWLSLLKSIQPYYPLLMIETEKKEPGIAFVGRVTTLTARYVDFEKVSRKGYWEAPERFAFKDITQIEFGDGYVDALAQLVEHESKA